MLALIFLISLMASGYGVAAEVTPRQVFASLRMALLLTGDEETYLRAFFNLRRLTPAQQAEVLRTPLDDNRPGFTVLHGVLARGWEGYALLLIEHHNLSLSSDETTVVHTLAAYGHSDLLKALVEKYPATTELINKHDAFGFTPTHYAARRGDNDMLMLLRTHGADPRIRTKESSGRGRLPIHVAPNEQCIRRTLQSWVDKVRLQGK